VNQAIEYGANHRLEPIVLTIRGAMAPLQAPLPLSVSPFGDRLPAGIVDVKSTSG
jgi:hypothetical protein